MPSQCGAIGCSNKVDADAKQRGITFHKVPSNPERRAIWKKALRRDFVITKFTVICSAHFEEKDMDRTGQTTRLRDGVVPSIFNFPDKDDESQPRRSKRKKTPTKRGRKNKVQKGSPNKRFSQKIYLPEDTTKAQKARKSIRGSRGRVKLEATETALTSPQSEAAPSPAPDAAAAAPVFSAEDHHYAIDPDSVKQKLDEAYVRIEELQKQLRNYKDRVKRKDAEFRVLMGETRRQNELMSELMEGSELWILCDKCGGGKK